MYRKFLETYNILLSLLVAIYLSHDIPFRQSSSFKTVASSLRTLDKPVVSTKSVIWCANFAFRSSIVLGRKFIPWPIFVSFITSIVVGKSSRSFSNSQVANIDLLTEGLRARAAAIHDVYLLPRVHHSDEYVQFLLEVDFYRYHWPTLSIDAALISQFEVPSTVD